MNKIYSIFCLFLLLSCELTTAPTDRYIESNFWQTYEQVNAGLTACYHSLRNTYLYGSDCALLSETLTPNAYCYNNYSGYSNIVNGNLNPANTTVVNKKWGACYQGIGRCNTFLEKIIPFSMNEDVKKFKIGEAKFLRAFFYFELINYYGDVPLILESPSIEKHATLPRDPKENILSQIVTDLKDAARNLPENYTSKADAGRPSKWSALALLSRVYLYNNRWEEAESCTKQIIDSGQHSLYPDYRKLFARENEGNSEVIFDVQFLNPQFQHGFDLIFRQYNTIAPLLDLVKAYEMRDGSEYDDSKSLYENRDPRFYHTIVYPGAMYMGSIVDKDRFKFTGYTYKKFSTYDQEYAPVYDWNDINLILIRYSDILLSYAEARNERLSTPDSEVLNAINAVRSRPGVEMPSIAPGLSKEDMREKIRKERRVELAGEGLYYFDIIRWKLAEIVNNQNVYKHDGSFLGKRSFDKKNYLWPVPEEEYKLNPNLLPNNTGW
ncbi:MAG: RagB/SusD family nutrient uptake outer membrane protein [Bacteroidales bacterium]